MSNATWLLPVLRDVGLDVKTVSGWEGRGRPASTGAFAPVGVLNHHTGTRGVDPHPSLGIITRGRPDLKGPLSQTLLARTSVIWIVAAGRCNHAGGARRSGPIVAGDGNEELIGIEVETSGYQHLTKDQRGALVLANAAILRHLHRDQDWARLHAETSVTGKWDLAEAGHTINAGHLRHDIGVALAALAPPRPRVTHLPVVDLSRIIHAFRVDSAARRDGTPGAYPAGVRLVESALSTAGFLNPKYAGDAYAGPVTIAAYMAHQRHLGYRGTDADGVPGMTSLVKLAARRHKFAVAA